MMVSTKIAVGNVVTTPELTVKQWEVMDEPKNNICSHARMRIRALFCLFFSFEAGMLCLMITIVCGVVGLARSLQLPYKHCYNGTQSWAY